MSAHPGGEPSPFDPPPGYFRDADKRKRSDRSRGDRRHGDRDRDDRGHRGHGDRERGSRGGHRERGKGKDKRRRRRRDDRNRVQEASEDEYVPTKDNSQQLKFYPREFADVNNDRPSSYFDFKRYDIPWTRGDDLSLGEKVGEGHFGEVIRARKSGSDTRLVVKTLKVSNRELVKLQQEVKMLEYIKGGENCVQLLGCVVVPEVEKKGLVFELIDSVDPKKLYPRLSDEERRFFALEILRGLRATHARGIIHRDIKPSNILMDPKTRTVRICDWGVAGFYRRDVRNNKGPGTRCYKAPELSLTYDYYDYAVDIWAFGLLFGSMVLLRRPFIPSKGGWIKQLQAVVKVVGSDALFAYMEKLQISIDTDSMDVLSGYRKVNFSSWISPDNKKNASPDALDLLSKLVVCDHTERLTATEAINHPYFDPVRDLPSGGIPNSMSGSWFSTSGSGTTTTTGSS